MATYYVDSEAGDDTNSGSELSPWLHCPGDTAATNNALAAGLALLPGDIIKLRRGRIYTLIAAQFINLLRSGAAGNPIIYDFDGWGTGDRCVITSNNVVVTAIHNNARKRDYIRLLGGHIYNVGGYDEEDAIWGTTTPVTKPPGGTGISLITGCTNILIEGWKFEEIGQWQTTAPMSGTLSMTGSGIDTESAKQLTINDCEFTKMRTGISIKARGSSYLTKDVEISNCDIHHNIVWGIDVAPSSSGSTLENILIRDTNIHDYSQCDEGNWTGYGGKPHRDGIFFRTSDMFSTWKNVRVTRCKFWDDDPAASLGGTASIFISQGPSVTVDNNVFLRDPQSGVIYYGGGKPAGMTCEIRILNNTIIGSSRPIRSASQGYIDSVDLLELRNNILYRETTNDLNDVININRWTDYQAEKLSPPTPERLVTFPLVKEIIDENNLIFTNNPAVATANVYSTNSPQSDLRGTSTMWRTLAQWRELTGTAASNVIANPLLTSMSGPPSTWDIRPGVGSYAIEGGADLSADHTLDVEGVTRTVPYDIGAHEVSADAPTDTPPTFTLQPVGRTLAPGSSVTFTASATGYPTPTYQWRKGAVNISGATSSSYAIASVQEGDEGNYSVVATNSSGSVASTPAALSVIDVAPVVQLRPRVTRSRLRAALE